MKKIILFKLLLLSQITVLPSSYAGILASSTRVVYSENSREKGLMLVNTNTYPIMTQLWTDDGSGDAEFEATPFTVFPSIFKLAPAEIKGIRIIFNGMQLPQDRESIFWLNMHEIPAIKKQALEKDHLNLAMNTQLKVFYRPQKLAALNVEKIQQQLSFQLINDENKQSIKITNPTAYYVSIIKLKISNPKYSSIAINNKENMISPFSSNTYEIINTEFSNFEKNVIHYDLLNDDGISLSFTNKL